MKNPKIIIIEGTDLSGKSFLMDNLVKKYPGLVIKNTFRPKKLSETTKYKKIIHSLLYFISSNEINNFDRIFFDRLYPSEMVYSGVKRDYDAFDDIYYQTVENTIKYKNHLLIYCYAPIDTLFDRYKNRGDDYIEKEELKLLSDRYEKYYNQSELNKIKLNTSESIDVLLEKLKEIIQ